MPGDALTKNKNRIITIVGNSGVGKTTFTRRLCQVAPFVTGLEQHVERPFHQLFSGELHKYALPNQIDFLLFRAEQELAIRAGDLTGVIDGGMDEDFFVFTRHFYQNGYLTEREYLLCERTYRFFREVLPPPDLIVWLTAPLEVIAARYARRGRKLEIARLEDLRSMEVLLEEWLRGVLASPVLTIDASGDDARYSESINKVLAQLSFDPPPK